MMMKKAKLRKKKKSIIFQKFKVKMNQNKMIKVE